MSTPAAQAIITKGLSCGRTTSCEGGTLVITGPFNLFCLTAMPPRSMPIGGGSRPMQPGEISQLYQPVPEEWQYIQVPREKEAEYFRRRKNVVISVNLGKFKTTKEYLVPEEKAKIMFNIVNALNVTRERMSVRVTNMKRIYTKAIVKLTSFRIK